MPAAGIFIRRFRAESEKCETPMTLPLPASDKLRDKEKNWSEIVIP